MHLCKKLHYRDQDTSAREGACYQIYFQNQFHAKLQSHLPKNNERQREKTPKIITEMNRTTFTRCSGSPPSFYPS